MVQPADGEQDQASERAKRPYSEPRVEMLGTIAELTLGGGGGSSGDNFGASLVG